MSCCGTTCSCGKIGGFRCRGTVVTDSCQCVEEESWNKNIPPKPNCEWLSNFKELRRLWSNHSRQQSCRCYACTSYRKAAICQSCLQSSYTGNNVDCHQKCCKDSESKWTSDSRSKNKSTSTSGYLLTNYNSQVTSFQNPRVHRSSDSYRSYSQSRRSILKKGICCQCNPECCFCQTTTKTCTEKNVCNCSSSAKDNSRDDRDCSSECPPVSRERRFPRNKIESLDKLCCRCQLPGYKCESYSQPTCDQCTSRRCKREDSDSSSNRPKSATQKLLHYETPDNFYRESHIPQNQIRTHNSSRTFNTFTEIINDDCYPHSCCYCCNLKTYENRKECINNNQQYHHSIKQNSLLPKNCFQCPICSSLLSSVPWKYSSTFMLPKLCKSCKFNAEMQNTLKFNSTETTLLPNDSFHPENSNFYLNSSINIVPEKFNKEDYNEKEKFHNQYQGEELENTFGNEKQEENGENIVKHNRSIPKFENLSNCQKVYCSRKNNFVKKESNIFSMNHDNEISCQFTSNALDSNKVQYKPKECKSCVKDCGHYRKKKKQVACKFKIDLDEDISNPNTYSTKLDNNNRFNSSKKSENFHQITESNKMENDIQESDCTIYWSSNQTLIDSQVGDKNQNENGNENKSAALKMKNLSSDIFYYSRIVTKNCPIKVTNDNLSESLSDGCIRSRQKNLPNECKLLKN